MKIDFRPFSVFEYEFALNYLYVLYIEERACMHWMHEAVPQQITDDSLDIKN